MADRLTAQLVGTKTLLRDLDRMDPSDDKRRIVVPFLLESMQLTLRIAAREKILPGGRGKPRKKILTSRTGTLRRSLGLSTSIDRSGLPNFIEGGTHLVYGRRHELGRHPRRPFLAPALADARTRFEAIFVKHWRKAGGL